uniref:NOT2/NOT3/NOT5 C-terminal domain-containing protein n=1 Tax=Nelumbo nucifera TaxID=4432 RepID=A0A822YK48_NELNU|nr:TPA_asm: hypothetical protein HUJ06_011821 [Nelumbo nucifera]
MSLPRGSLSNTLPECYYAEPPPVLHQGYFAKFQLETLLCIFYSMPKDEAQLYAANELYVHSMLIYLVLYILSLTSPNYSCEKLPLRSISLVFLVVNFLCIVQSKLQR